MTKKSSTPAIRFKGFTDTWEQRKFDEVFDCTVPNNTLSRAELSYDEGTVLNVHYGDVLIKYGSVLDVQKDNIPRIPHRCREDFNGALLQDGDVIIADTAEDETTGKACEIGNLQGSAIVSGLHTMVCRPRNRMALGYLGYYLNSNAYHHQLLPLMQGIKVLSLSRSNIQKTSVSYPIAVKEQQLIAYYFSQLDNLITLHQRKHFLILEDIMLNNINKMDLFYDYYAQWITVYKEGAIRKVTMDKYLLTQSWIKQLAPELRVCELSRITYQKLLNDYAKSHERQTTMDFHHQLKGAVLDAVDEGLIERDPTRKAIIKGKKPRHKKIKYLNQFELHKLLSNLDLGQEINWDWFILLVAKTGMRFSEALAITPKDFDFSKQSLSINKTWDYKGEGGFMPTKNQSSVRKIQIDWQLIIQFSTLVKDLPEDEPIFVSGKVYNSTVNDILERHCKKAEIPVISIHGLRHTHASLLLFAGVSIASVAQRLGHSSMTTTQKTYLHIIQELENKDVDLVMRSLSSLN